VADSQEERMQENLDSYQQLLDNLRFFGKDPATFPAVIQYNKRDSGNAIPVGAIESRLGLSGVPVFESVASKGKGVLETIRNVRQTVVRQLRPA